MTTVEIAGIPIGDGHPCRVVCELGTNHGGDIALALKMIRAAKVAAADFIKLQTRTPQLSVPESEWHELRDTPWGKMGKLEYRKRVEFGLSGYLIIAEHCEKCGIPWFISVWDIPSVEFMRKSGLPIHALKIPSARLHDTDLIASASDVGCPVILSTGMSTIGDVDLAVNVLCHHNVPKILLQCTSSYPARADESDLRVIQTYKREFACPVGFSSHKIGQLTCLLAVAAGANLIERHVTTSRLLLGSDHRMSTTTTELSRLVSEIRYVESCLGDGVKRVHESELGEIRRLRVG